MTADIEVVIPTFGRAHAINQTLHMLLGQDVPPKRVIVVNQTPGVTDADPSVRRAYSDACLELLWINREAPSLTGARNDALRAAKAEICLFLDDDVLIPPDLVWKHWMKYQDGSKWEAVGGQVWHRLDRVPVADISLDRPHAGTTSAVPVAELIPEGPLFGGHFSVRRETALALGGWDEALVGSANYEESDFIDRLKANGILFVWDPAPWIIHLRLPFGGCRIPGNNAFPEWTKSMNFFLYKYRHPRASRWSHVLWSSLRAGPLRREIVVNPWRWPTAWRGLFEGWREGRKRARNPILPFIQNRSGVDR